MCGIYKRIVECIAQRYQQQYAFRKVKINIFNDKFINQKKRNIT